MDAYIIKFIISFAGGLLWFRILFFIIPIYFEKPLIRSLLNMRWHHLHYGIVLIFIGAVLLLLSEKSTAVIVIFGIGLGFITDIFIPSLQLKTDRGKELAVYRDSLLPTLFLGGLIVVVIFILSFLNF